MSETVAHSAVPVTCPSCGKPARDVVFLPEGGACCVPCRDSLMTAAVRAWRDGDLHRELAASLERYIEDSCVSS